MLRTKKDEVYNLTGGRCYYCGIRLDRYNFHVDHFIPQSKRGKNKNNLVPACPDCNNLKSDLDVEEFRWKIMVKAIPFIEEQLEKHTFGRVFNNFCLLPTTLPTFYFEKENIDKKV